MAVITTTCSIKPSIPKTLNEVVQVSVKVLSLSQSQAYQRGTFLLNMRLLGDDFPPSSHPDGVSINLSNLDGVHDLQTASSER
ncbi:hypothetical protein KSP40_PGU001648 [Platanthera guangdongensis]|uniref:Uncharacterized protein n=1 Tax=Platanthera guangdongensis TaxID=2320717 RepID=A0ABR2MXJ8_9ASPA